MKQINAAVAFALEIAMLAAFGYWGAWVGGTMLARWGLAIGLPLAAAIIWGFFFAPRARWRLALLPGAAVSLGLFLAGAAALYCAGQQAAGVAMAAVAVVNRALVLLWRQW